jgi:hypothetical protein
MSNGSEPRGTSLLRLRCAGVLDRNQDLTLDLNTKGPGSWTPSCLTNGSKCGVQTPGEATSRGSRAQARQVWILLPGGNVQGTKFDRTAFFGRPY